MLGWMHYLGRGTQQDRQKGIKIIRENRSDEFPFGEDECLAVRCFTSSNSPGARRFYQLCRLGSDREWLCRHLVAVCLFDGFGVSEDRPKAVDILQQLAHDGHSDSQFWIGESHQCFHKIPRDSQRAFQWWSRSADQGNPYGQRRIGVSYYHGVIVSRNDTKAFEWLRKSADQGYQLAQYWLGDCYKSGRGVAKDIDAAALWYRKAAEQGHEESTNILMVMNKWP
ncbi:uncharacterized protein BJ171DRAFT_498081 [Polychytrium aggregatum]|uniref:uncharacterized protein n=1 Tax=Polychytrium aggregatum TaxID=110093 RepID=UPI0022FE1586|nr:uncharacterized protein BJ171DRAFT_498081 [Polychytrium aggregatum]KAI9206523.1 hypothetical protein BJ171DRAFT_498081 [Polychytrium aggregatum]